MILLTSTSDLLRVTTSSAAAVKVHASHVDRSGAAITPGRLNTAIASATTTTIVTSPAASTDRTVKFVSIYNDDASLSVTVTILHTDGTTAVDMWSATLAPQQGLQYDEGAGWSAPEGIYATSAQGALADTAVQPADDAADLGSGAATDGYVLTADGAGGAAWEAAAGGGGTPGGSTTQMQFNDGGAFGGDSGFTFDKTNKTLNVTGATITASDPIIDMAQTWNNAAVAFTAVKANVTDTASAAGSLLMDLQVGGVSQFSVNKSTGISFRLGAKAVTFNNDYGLQLSTGSSLAFSIGTAAYAIMTSAGWSVNTLCFGIATGSVTLLQQDGSTLHTLAQRNGVNAQTSRIYGTYTDASNYRRLTKTMSTAGVAEIKPEGAGTGVSGNVLHISGLPTSNPGPGILWNNAGTPAIGT